MKKWIKWNWGKGIAVAYSAFALMMLVLVYKASSQDFNLVSKDYYEREINYQGHIDQVARTNALREKVVIQQGAESVMVQFPKSMKDITGKISLYRSSDAKLDKSISISPDNENGQAIPLTTLPKGNWTIQVAWNTGGVAYYNEQQLNLK